MSPRLLDATRFDALRLDALRLDAMVFRADSVRFEACATFRSATFPGSDDTELCECGWLEVDHVVAAGRRQFLGRRPRRRLQPAAVRTAS
jgi:hypothetical protein